MYLLTWCWLIRTHAVAVIVSFKITKVNLRSWRLAPLSTGLSTIVNKGTVEGGRSSNHFVILSHRIVIGLSVQTFLVCVFASRLIWVLGNSSEHFY